MPTLRHVMEVSPKDAQKLTIEYDMIQTLKGKVRFRSTVILSTRNKQP